MLAVSASPFDNEREKEEEHDCPDKGHACQDKVVRPVVRRRHSLLSKEIKDFVRGNSPCDSKVN